MEAGLPQRFCLSLKRPNCFHYPIGLERSKRLGANCDGDIKGSGHKNLRALDTASDFVLHLELACELAPKEGRRLS